MVIVDDHKMVAEGLAAMLRLESDLEVLGVAGTVASGLELVGSAQPAVVVMDFHLPDGNGVEATAAIRERWPHIHVVMLTGSGASSELSRAIEAGCSGFLDKALEGQNLGAAVRAVSRGEVVIHAGAMQEAVPGLRKPAGSPVDLTARELEILKLLANGVSTDAMARELHVALSTLRNHIANILSKLGAHSRLEAVAVAIRDGLVSVES